MSLNRTSKRSISLDIFREEDNCGICNTESVSNTCNKCGDGVCTHPSCQWSFPDKHNETYVLCDYCFNTINKKLLNYDHLIIYKFLKKHTNGRRLSC